MNVEYYLPWLDSMESVLLVFSQQQHQQSPNVTPGLPSLDLQFSNIYGQIEN